MHFSRVAAVELLDDGHGALSELIGSLSAETMVRTGLGGGEWSPKDLVGHIASWEEHALEALDSWDRNQAAQVNRDLDALGTDEVNARAVIAWSKLAAPEVTARAEASHMELIRRIRALTDERWGRPPTSRGRWPLSDRLGSILGGPGGAFRHADAHLPDLEEFVRLNR